MHDFASNMKVVPLIHPQTINGATNSSSWYDMADFGRVVFLVDVGDTDTTVDAAVYQATDSSGTGSKVISGAEITQIAATEDNRLVSIDVPQTALDIANGFRYVQLQVTVGSGTTGAVVCALAEFYRAGEYPVTQPSDYAEQVRVDA